MCVLSICEYMCVCCVALGGIKKSRWCAVYLSVPYCDKLSKNVLALKLKVDFISQVNISQLENQTHLYITTDIDVYRQQEVTVCPNIELRVTLYWKLL